MPSDSLQAIPAQADETVVPIHIEEAVVSKRTVQTGVVRVSLTTSHHEKLVEEELACERVVVEHVPVERWVDAVPPIREEGDTTILSIVEEVLVIERRLLLKEEIRLTRTRTTEVHRETVQLRKQAATVTRIQADGSSAGLVQTSLSETKRDMP